MDCALCRARTDVPQVHNLQHNTNAGQCFGRGGRKKICPCLRNNNYALTGLLNNPTSPRPAKEARSPITLLTRIQAPEARCQSLSPRPSRTRFATMLRRQGKSDATLEAVGVHRSARRPDRCNGQKILDVIRRFPAHTHPLWPPACDRWRSTCSRSYPARRVVGRTLCRSRPGTPVCGWALRHSCPLP